MPAGENRVVSRASIFGLLPHLDEHIAGTLHRNSNKEEKSYLMRILGRYTFGICGMMKNEGQQLFHLLQIPSRRPHLVTDVAYIFRCIGRRRN